MPKLSTLPAMTAGLMLALAPAVGLAATRDASEAEYRGIRASLQAQSPATGRVKLWSVKVGKGAGGSGQVQLVCGYANGARFYGTLSRTTQGKPHMTVMGTNAIADAMCAEKLGV